MTAEERLRALAWRIESAEENFRATEATLRLAESCHEQAADNLAKAKDSFIEAAKEMINER